MRAPLTAVLAAVAGLMLLAGCTSSSTPARSRSASDLRGASRSASLGVDAATTRSVTHAARVAAPPVNGTFDYQLGGSYQPARGVTVVDRDSTSVPVRGVYSVCYVNAFQTQEGQQRFWTTRHPDLLVHDHGHLVKDPDWPEYLLDTSTAAHRSALLGIVGSVLDDCARKGFRAIEPDNLDSYTRSKGHLTWADNLAFARLLIARAHHDHLAIAQKNEAEHSGAGRHAGFDFAVAEECQVYGECGYYTAAYGRHVIEIEYTDNPLRYYSQACTDRGAKISVILRDRDVVPRGASGYRYRAC